MTLVGVPDRAFGAALIRVRVGHLKEYDTQIMNPPPRAAVLLVAAAIARGVQAVFTSNA